MIQMHSLIQESPSPSNLRIFLGCLSQEKPTVSVREMEYVALTYSLLAQVYKTDLKDSYDKPPDLTKTIKRIISTILKRFFTQKSASIQQTCARVLIDISEFCLPDSHVSLKLSLLYEPLMTSIVSGDDKVVQKNACASIYEYVLYLLSKCQSSSDERGKKAFEQLQTILADLISCFTVQIYQ